MTSLIVAAVVIAGIVGYLLLTNKSNTSSEISGDGLPQQMAVSGSSDDNQNTGSAPTRAKTVTLANIAVGDSVGGLTVSSIEGQRVYFSGQATVAGTFTAQSSFDGAASFSVAESDAMKLPHYLVDPQNGNVRICLTNSDATRHALANKSGQITITVKNYVLEASENRVCDMAEFVAVQ